MLYGKQRDLLTKWRGNLDEKQAKQAKYNAKTAMNQLKNFIEEIISGINNPNQSVSAKSVLTAWILHNYATEKLMKEVYAEFDKVANNKENNVQN